MIISLYDHFGDSVNEIINKPIYWSRIIGSGVDYNYLHYLLRHNNKIILNIKKKNIHGILIYGRINNKPYREKLLGIWEVKLLIKTKISSLPNIGKELMYWLEEQKDVKRIMLIDRCIIPNYYYNLGYRQIKNRRLFKKILNINITPEVYYKCVKYKKKKNKYSNNVS